MKIKQTEKIKKESRMFGKPYFFRICGGVPDGV